MEREGELEEDLPKSTPKSVVNLVRNLREKIKVDAEYHKEQLELLTGTKDIVYIAVAHTETGKTWDSITELLVPEKGRVRCIAALSPGDKVVVIKVKEEDGEGFRTE